MSGFPFLSGFYSKDLILEAFLAGGINIIMCFMVVFSTCLTAVYSGILIYSVFFSSIFFRQEMTIVSNVYLSVPCCILGLGALFGGITMQSVVLDFNVVFEVHGILKLIPTFCVIRGVVGVIRYIKFSNS